MDRNIRTVDDVLRLLDGLFAPEADRWSAHAGSCWWDSFYADRSQPVPFFVTKPDENLVSYLARSLITPGRALDVGCGPGRNALHLASAGFTVHAVDLSPAAIAWATARDTGADVHFHCGDAFATDLDGPYDLIYDSGCFHHLPPHRRISYLALLHRALTPGGHLALICFAAGAMGSDIPDADLYRHARLDGGLAYTPESLRWIFSHLTEVELRRMRNEPPESPHFGEPFLWTALFHHDSHPEPRILIIPVPAQQPHTRHSQTNGGKLHGRRPIGIQQRYTSWYAHNNDQGGPCGAGPAGLHRQGPGHHDGRATGHRVPTARSRAALDRDRERLRAAAA